jgi:coproporphyrinogen III oxidase-like Fe-S oxidoreductase
MLGLRMLKDGVSPRSFAQRHGASLIDQFGPQLARLTSMGLLEADEARVRLTTRGVLLANSVCAEFL